MRTKDIFVAIFAAIFLISFVSASSSYTVQHEYYADDTHVKTVYYTFDKDYRENENRYSVWDYRDGYTYRTSKEYLEDKYGEKYTGSYYTHRNSFKKYSGKVTYYEYVPYMKNYVEKTCYNSAPSGKLFYIKCDF